MDGKPTETEAAAAATIDKPEVVAKPRAEVAELQRAPETTPPAATPAPLSPDTDDPLLRDIIAALKTVYDPEIPSDIYELGLIYAVDVDDERNVAISMTLTAPGCPVAGEMPKWVENAVGAVPGVKSATVTMTFVPPWDMSRMSDEARLALNMF